MTKLKKKTFFFLENHPSVYIVLYLLQEKTPEHKYSVTFLVNLYHRVALRKWPIFINNANMIMNRKEKMKGTMRAVPTQGLQFR